MAERWNGLLDQVATDEQQEQMYRYFELMLDWNQRLNLTAITDLTEAAVKHFWDSLSLHQADLRSLTSAQRVRVADVGTGAGLPGLPLAICHPDWSFVLFDSLNKRLVFLKHVVTELGLKNVELVHGRAEDLAHDARFRNQFDLVVSRAVARLRVLLELTVPFCRPGGLLAAYKGSAVHEELSEASEALKALRAEVVEDCQIDLPLGFGQHHILLVSPLAATPKAYPRKAGTPQKQPL